MKVAIMQPTFLPWLGYFGLVRSVDLFVFLDDAQLSIQSWQQRNRLFVNTDQVDWYTLPLRRQRAHFKPLNESEINDELPWRRKFWQRLAQNYAKAPHFKSLAPGVETWLQAPYRTVAQRNIAFIHWVWDVLGWKPEHRYSSQLPPVGTRSERVLQILEWCGATEYRSAQSAFAYMREDGVWPHARLRVLFQDFISHPYPQVGSTSGFVQNLAVLDALFNVGPAQTEDLISRGAARWLSWDDMARRTEQPASAIA